MTCVEPPLRGALQVTGSINVAVVDDVGITVRASGDHESGLDGHDERQGRPGAPRRAHETQLGAGHDISVVRSARVAGPFISLAHRKPRPSTARVGRGLQATPEQAEA